MPLPSNEFLKVSKEVFQKSDNLSNDIPFDGLRLTRFAVANNGASVCRRWYSRFVFIFKCSRDEQGCSYDSDCPSYRCTDIHDSRNIFLI